MTAAAERVEPQPLWADTTDRLARQPGETEDEYTHRMLTQSRAELKEAKDRR
jgi:hypothetical protein